MEPFVSNSAYPGQENSETEKEICSITSVNLLKDMNCFYRSLKERNLYYSFGFIIIMTLCRLYDRP